MSSMDAGPSNPDAHTQISRRPQSSRMLSMKAKVSFSSVTSSGYGTTLVLGYASDISFNSASPTSVVEDVGIQANRLAAPCAASSWRTALPIDEFEPVTTHTNPNYYIVSF